MLDRNLKPTPVVFFVQQVNAFHFSPRKQSILFNSFNEVVLGLLCPFAAGHSVVVRFGQGRADVPHFPLALPHPFL